MSEIKSLSSHSDYKLSFKIELNHNEHIVSYSDKDDIRSLNFTSLNGNLLQDIIEHVLNNIPGNFGKSFETLISALNDNKFHQFIDVDNPV